MTNFVIMYSGGIGSWYAAKRIIDDHPDDKVTLLFADVKGQSGNPHIGEDEDTYRFIEESSKQLGAELVTVADGRDMWELFKDVRFLGTSQIAPCSKYLKQIPCKQWLRKNMNKEDTFVVVGIDWMEIHRIKFINEAYAPWKVLAPLCGPPYLSREDMLKLCEESGVKPPRAYSYGHPHNNCGGSCVRAGQGQFIKLLDFNRDRYKVWEEKEQEVRDHIKKDITILRIRENGKLRKITLKEFREKHESSLLEVDELDIGRCACI